MLRNLPSVNEVLELEPVAQLVAAHGRQSVLQWVRGELDLVRQHLMQAETVSADASAGPDRETLSETLADRVCRRALESDRLHVRNVINATGVVLHTGLGRSPLSSAARQALQEAAAACNVEVDLETSDRRYRGYQLEASWQLLTGCESSLIVNNNAAATLLTLQSLCRGREVVISRGELIEIGGSFRLPEIFELSGATLKEVGTTNRTKLSDYEDAIGPDTAAIMHVHPSNFRVVGFSDKPAENDLFELAHRHGLIAIDDIGSGALFDLKEAGLPEEPSFQDSIAAGADVVLGSGDKLLGGPQAGIIIGKEEYVGVARKHPLARATRVDKLTLAALGATLDSYLTDKARDELPTLAMLTASVADLQARAQLILSEIGTVDGLTIEIQEDVAQVGGGSLPAVELPTVVLSVEHDAIPAGRLVQMLRLGRISVFGRVQDDRVLLDVRSVLREDDARLALAVRLIRPEENAD